MDALRLVLAPVVAAAVALLLILVAKPELTQGRPGKMLAFLGIFLLPVLGLWVGGEAHLQHSKSTEFCLSCHVMDDHGKSLRVDDEEFVAAAHYLNNWVPQDKACFTCHTDYTMYGDWNAKLRGLRHVWVNYTGRTPEELELYSPYHNRECLHCHGEARGFLEDSAHSEEDTTMASLRANRMSCLEAGCHDVVHGIDELEDVDFWHPPAPQPAARAGAPPDAASSEGEEEDEE